MLAPLTIEALQETFFREECPYWWAYDAKKTSHKVGQFRLDESEDELLQDSWNQLDYLINSYPYGHLLLKCKKNVNDNEKSTHYWHVKWGEDLMPLGRGRSTNTRQSGYNNQQMTGQWQMMQFIMQQQAQFHSTQLKQVEEIARLNFENQRLADSVHGTVEPSIQEYALKEGIEIFKSWVGPKINPGQFQPQNTGALGIAGQRNLGEAASPPAPAKRGTGVSFDAVMADVNSVYHSLGKKYDPNEITRALAIFCQQNAAAADQFLGPMIQQLRQHAQSQGQDSD